MKLMTLMLPVHLVCAQAIYSEVSSIYNGDVIKTWKQGKPILQTSEQKFTTITYTNGL